jgi:hypothetical protein
LLIEVVLKKAKRNKPKPKAPTKAFMCATDWFIEMPSGPEVGFPELYRTMKALRKERKCSRYCGIVEVELKLVKLRVKGKREK